MKYLDVEHGRVAGDNERQQAELLEHVSQADGQLVAQVDGRLEEVRVVAAHSHVHHGQRVEADEWPLARLVDVRIAVEVRERGEAFARAGRHRARLVVVVDVVAVAVCASRRLLGYRCRCCCRNRGRGRCGRWRGSCCHVPAGGVVVRVEKVRGG